MNEWVVFGVIVSVIGAFLAVYTPLRNSAKERESDRLEQEKEAAKARNENTKAITELTTSLKIFTEHFNQVEADNRTSHKEIYKRLDEKGKKLASHEERLNEHERRIQDQDERISILESRN